MNKPSNAQIRHDLSGPKLEPNQANKDGNSFPLTLAKVTRVDSRKLVVDLITMSGPPIPYQDVQIPFPAAGARHFLGALPEEADLCVIGYGHEESGFSRRPFILAWLIPGVTMGYDWIVSQFTNQEDLALTPSIQESLKGIVGRRRHKAMLLDTGNVAGSSAQGSDFVLSESVLLTNRRGNEILLRDQDQAMVVRTLQQFHAGAGFRIYGGMVQRDATLLPTQTFSDGIDWTSDRQVDGQGNPLLTGELGASATGTGYFNDNPLFSAGFPATLQPSVLMQRGLFINADGTMYDGAVVPQSVYGGKPFYRVSYPSGGPQGDPTRTLTEYRIEVAHTSDGTLPVTEQTDGVDIDRLPPAPPSKTIDPLQVSENSPLVEFVLGTAVGNDPYGARQSYGVPLKPILYTKDGQLAPGLVPVEPGDPVTEHAAVLIQVTNPSDPGAPKAFWAITKGGTLRSYFPGKGSKGLQEIYGSGKVVSLGRDEDGNGYVVSSEGVISLINTTKGSQSNNVGVALGSIGGAVEITAGGAKTGPSEGVDALVMTSGAGARVEAATRLKLAAPSVEIIETNSVAMTANTSVDVSSGDRLALTAKTHAVTVTGRADYSFGGPKDALPTNGPSRSTIFTANPVTGGIGGTVDEYMVLFGARKETFLYGRHDTDVLLGSYNVRTAQIPPIPQVGTGDGVNLSAGPLGLDQSLVLSSPLGGGGAVLGANLGNVTMRATKGQAVVQAIAGVSIQTPALMNITAATVTVTVPTVNPGGVITDGVIDGLTGRPFLSGGTIGVPTFRVG